MAGFLDVILRGVALCGQAVAIGGVLFVLVVLRPAVRERSALAPLCRRSRRLIAAGALAVALAHGLSLAAQVHLLADQDGWPLREVLATGYFLASLLRIGACVAIVAVCWAWRRDDGAAWRALLLLSVALAIASALTSHAASRVEHRAILLALDALHQFAVAAWAGGLAHLTALAFRPGAGTWPAIALRRFSAMAMAAVAVLVIAGVALTAYYVDGIDAVYGTAYGMMVTTKVVVLVGLLGLGALNFTAVRRLAGSADVLPTRLRRFVEVELGLAFTVLFAAASLTSLPPAVDVVADRATLAEVALRFTPRLPALTSPRHADMPVDDPTAPRTDADRAWSEYNHHFAGFFVLAMGLLAIAHVAGGRWARHWPLVFLGLAVFLLIRNDPGSWPLGPQGFWEGFLHAEVLQHRIFVLLVVAFGVFEWVVRTGRIGSRWALLFPVLCAVGGGLLLTHSHASFNLKDEYLIEVTHAPLGVLGMVVGWGRWLELRLTPGDRRLPGLVWPIAFTAIGLLLIFYRES